MVGPKERPLPIISYVGWFEGQTCVEFLGEIFSIMLRQLAKNLRRGTTGTHDQEVYVVDFRGPYIFIIRTYFTGELIKRVHPNRCPGDENYVKEDWLRAMSALARSLRYPLSRKAKVGAIQRCISCGAHTVSNDI
ncbi:hypothetical protein BDV29DRAFT_196711 [Aspergillus leporis]|uniref:Uncharacterized protein n=1 Tax=Aspergillus leporis TaxID=41062 RepID=A0A5N5WFT7_9EURO|nr:hypothetical protein BDV29DRAFT_196711 [Aspergillus leporis]